MTTFYDSKQKPHEKPDDAEVVWRMGAYGVLENDKGEWLMVEPSWTKNLDFPGGGIHEEERIVDGLVREFYEETGYRVNVDPQPLFLGENNFYYKGHGPFCHAVMIIYRVTLQSEERDAHVVNTFEDGYEIADMRWVHPDTMTKDNVQPPVWQYIEFIRNSQ